MSERNTSWRRIESDGAEWEARPIGGDHYGRPGKQMNDSV